MRSLKIDVPAIDYYRRTAPRTTNAPERDYVLLHAAGLTESRSD